MGLDSWLGAAGALVLVILATIVLGGQCGTWHRRIVMAPQIKARADVVSISGAVHEFARRNGGRLPNALEELVRPDERGASYLDCAEMPPDPWGAPYRYELQPDAPGFRVTSLGADGRPGGDGEDADVSSLTVRAGSR